MKRAPLPGQAESKLPNPSHAPPQIVASGPRTHRTLQPECSTAAWSITGAPSSPLSPPYPNATLDHLHEHHDLSALGLGHNRQAVMQTEARAIYQEGGDRQSGATTRPQTITRQHLRNRQSPCHCSHLPFSLQANTMRRVLEMRT